MNVDGLLMRMGLLADDAQDFLGAADVGGFFLSQSHFRNSSMLQPRCIAAVAAIAHHMLFPPRLYMTMDDHPAPDNPSARIPSLPTFVFSFVA
jgi:hypothetical protein